MSSAAQATATTGSRKLLFAGRAMSGLVVLFLLFDSIGKLMRVPQVMKGTTELGISASLVVPIGIVLLVCTVLYAIPRTSVLGAILLSGYLGGAVAIQLRVGNPLFGYVLFPVYLGILLWGGLYCREPKVARSIPFKSND